MPLANGRPRFDSMKHSDLVRLAPAQLRRLIAEERYVGSTAGLAQGYVQCNVVILPRGDAAEFEEFCRLNSQPCPLIDVTAPGDPTPRQAAAEADLRIHVPRYRVFRRGIRDEVEPTDIRSLWRDDFVGFLLGCSFTFEWALRAAGLPVRHIDEGRNVPMYRTNIPCHGVGKFTGPLVVSMRPYRPDQVQRACEITACYPRMHGAPLHTGDAAAIGISDIDHPDFGDPVTIHAGEVPVFWACGVTPQLALENARCELAITHSPGHMFITDLRDEEFYECGPCTAGTCG
jgi:uncharacterized protein YcsI (UPF0317 family)